MPKIYRPKGGRPTKHEIRHKNSGRPTVMTLEVLAKLEEGFKLAFTDEQACSHANIGKDSLYDYIKKYPKFGEQKERWKRLVDNMAKAKLVESIQEGDPNSVKFWLERKCKEEFSTRQELTGADGKQLMPPKIIISTTPIKNGEKE